MQAADSFLLHKTTSKNSPCALTGSFPVHTTTVLPSLTLRLIPESQQHSLGGLGAACWELTEPPPPAERFRLLADVQRQPADGVPEVLRQLDGVER